MKLIRKWNQSAMTIFAKEKALKKAEEDARQKVFEEEVRLKLENASKIGRDKILPKEKTESGETQYLLDIESSK